MNKATDPLAPFPDLPPTQEQLVLEFLMFHAWRRNVADVAKNADQLARYHECKEAVRVAVREGYIMTGRAPLADRTANCTTNLPPPGGPV